MSNMDFIPSLEEITEILRSLDQIAIAGITAAEHGCHSGSLEYFNKIHEQLEDLSIAVAVHCKAPFDKGDFFQSNSSLISSQNQ